jgi:hypothetical protein
MLWPLSHDPFSLDREGKAGCRAAHIDLGQLLDPVEQLVR